MRRDRVFIVALGLSTLLHLSMVTLFTIVITFRIEPTQYWSFDIVDARTMQPMFRTQATPMPTLKAPDLLADPALPPLHVGELAGTDTPAAASGLPEITLPRIEFAELEQLEARERGLQTGVRYESMLERNPQDPWTRFNEELDQFRNALRDLPLFDRSEDVEDTPAATLRPEPAARPAEGFAAYIEWMTEPKDRALLFAPQVEALHDVAPSELIEPVVVVFRVNPLGRVVEVLTPVEDEKGIVSGVGRALLRYRFEPLPSEATEDQRGTLIVAPETYAP